MQSFKEWRNIAATVRTDEYEESDEAETKIDVFDVKTQVTNEA